MLLAAAGGSGGGGGTQLSHAVLIPHGDQQQGDRCRAAGTAFKAAFNTGPCRFCSLLSRSEPLWTATDSQKILNIASKGIKMM